MEAGLVPKEGRDARCKHGAYLKTHRETPGRPRCACCGSGEPDEDLRGGLCRSCRPCAHGYWRCDRACPCSGGDGGLCDGCGSIQTVLKLAARNRRLRAAYPAGSDTVEAALRALGAAGDDEARAVELFVRAVAEDVARKGSPHSRTRPGRS